MAKNQMTKNQWAKNQWAKNKGGPVAALEASASVREHYLPGRFIWHDVGCAET